MNLGVMILSPRQRDQKIGQMIVAHYVRKRRIAGPFGTIVGYVLHTLPDRVLCFTATGERRSPLPPAQGSPAQSGEAARGVRCLNRADDKLVIDVQR